MGIKVTKRKGKFSVSISEEMTIYTAAELKEDLVKHLNECQSMQINLRDVEEMDTAGLQIMLLLEKEANDQQKEFKFVEHSQAVIDMLELSNLSAFFGDPIVYLAEDKKS